MTSRAILIGLVLVAVAIIAPFSLASGSGGGRHGHGDDDDDEGSCAAITGNWQVDAHRSASPFFRPVNETFHSDGTVWAISGTNVVPLGFSSRSGLAGDCRSTGHNHFQVRQEEFLYQSGWVAGRFLVILNLVYNPADDSLSGTGSFRITVFRSSAPAAAPAACTPDVPLASTGVDLFRDGASEFTCREAADIILSASRLATDPFFAGTGE